MFELDLSADPDHDHDLELDVEDDDDDDDARPRRAVTPQDIAFAAWIEQLDNLSLEREGLGLWELDVLLELELRDRFDAGESPEQTYAEALAR